jgi:hypothetical protein
LALTYFPSGSLSVGIIPPVTDALHCSFRLLYDGLQTASTAAKKFDRASRIAR